MAKRKFTYTSRYAYATLTDRTRTHGNGPLWYHIMYYNFLCRQLLDWCQALLPFGVSASKAIVAEFVDLPGPLCHKPSCIFNCII